MAILSDSASHRDDSGGKTSASYDITLSCGTLLVHNVNIEDTEGLSLSQCCVMEAGALSCGHNDSEIIMPPCLNYMTERLCVTPESPCQTLCGMAQPADGDASRGCIPTSTDIHASVRAAHIGDTITYTITFTNHSPFLLEMVRISADIPEGISVIPDSIVPSPGPGEALATGISMGSVAAMRAVTLTYNAIVRIDASTSIVNRGCAEYYYLDSVGCPHRGAGSRRSSIVKILPRCFCQCVECRFPIRDFRCFRYCYIYYTGTTFRDTVYGRMISGGYGIAVKYVDRDGQSRGMSYEGSAAFLNIPYDFTASCLSVRFTDLVCCTDDCHCFYARFKAKLCCNEPL